MLLLIDVVSVCENARCVHNTLLHVHVPLLEGARAFKASHQLPPAAQTFLFLLHELKKLGSVVKFRNSCVLLSYCVMF